MSGDTLVNAETGELTVLFTKTEAEAATAKLKGYFGVSCQLVKELHDKQAWKAMGYGSWAAYTKAEFDISRSRSYQLIKYAEVVAGLASVAQVPIDDMAAALTEGAARSITAAEIDEVSTNVDTSASDRAEVAASAAVAAARARREAEAAAPEQYPVECTVTDCPTTAGPDGLCAWHRGKLAATADAAEQIESQQVPAPAAAHVPVQNDAATSPAGVDAGPKDGGRQADPHSAPPAVTPSLACTWRDDIAHAGYLLRHPVALLAAALGPDDVIDLYLLFDHLGQILDAHKEQNA